jgi:hypothetical protein
MCFLVVGLSIKLLNIVYESLATFSTDLLFSSGSRIQSPQSNDNIELKENNNK